MTQSSLYALANLCAKAAEEAGSRGVTGQAAVWGTREEWTARELACREAMRQLRNAPGEAAGRDIAALTHAGDQLLTELEGTRARVRELDKFLTRIRHAIDEGGTDYLVATIARDFVHPVRGNER